VSEPRDLRRAFVVEEAKPVLPPTGPCVESAPPIRAVEAQAHIEEPDMPTADLAATGAATPTRRRLTPLRLLGGAALGLLVSAAVVDAWRFLDQAFATSVTLGSFFALLFALLIGAVGWTAFAMRRDLRTLAEVGELRQRARTILDGGDELDLAAPEFVAALARHYAGQPQFVAALESFQDRVDSSMPARWQLEQVSREVLAPLDQAAFATVKRHSQQAALLAMLSRVPLADFLIALWRSLVIVRQVARTYGARPGTAGTWRLWRGVLRNVLYAEVSEVAADTLSQVLGGGVAAKVSVQAAQGLGMGLLIGRLGLEAIRACRPMPFTGREATQPSLKVLGEGMLQLVKSGLTRPPP
jgi:putative membrane protein